MPTITGLSTELLTADLVGNELLAVDKADGTTCKVSIDSVLALGGGATNLSTSVSSTAVTVLSDTGTDATLAAATGTDAGVMSAAMQVKLSGIETGATANSSDAALLARANHTGTQASSTIADFSEAVDDRVAALLVAGSNVTITYNDTSNTLEIAAATSSGQSGIQFKDEGSNLGTSGTATVVDFVGSGVTASRVGDTVTVTITAGSASGSGDFYFQSTAPSSPTPAVGSRWVNSDTGVEFTYIDDGTSTQWVEVGTSLDAIGGVLPVVNGGTGVSSLTSLLTALLAGTSPVSLAEDNKELRLGASSDLRIYHDGTNSVIENDTGDLVIKANAELDLRELTTTVSSPSAGGAGALPATPLGYLNIKVDGTLRKFPYYA